MKWFHESGLFSAFLAFRACRYSAWRCFSPVRIPFAHVLISLVKHSLGLMFDRGGRPSASERLSVCITLTALLQCVASGEATFAFVLHISMKISDVILDLHTGATLCIRVNLAAAIRTSERKHTCEPKKMVEFDHCESFDSVMI